MKATEWVLELPFPPDGNEKAELAASGRPDEGWPEDTVPLNTGMFEAQTRREEYRRRPAIPANISRMQGLGSSSSSHNPWAR